MLARILPHNCITPATVSAPRTFHHHLTSANKGHHAISSYCTLMQQCAGQETYAADAATHSRFGDRAWIGERQSARADEDEHLEMHPSSSNSQELQGWRFSVMTYNILADQYVRVMQNLAWVLRCLTSKNGITIYLRLDWQR